MEFSETTKYKCSHILRMTYYQKSDKWNRSFEWTKISGKCSKQLANICGKNHQAKHLLAQSQQWNTRTIRSFASIVKFEHILHLSLMFPLLTFNRYFFADCINIYRIVLAPSVSSFDFIFNLAFLTWYLPGICQWNVKKGKSYIFVYQPLKSPKTPRNYSTITQIYSAEICMQISS